MAAQSDFTSQSVVLVTGANGHVAQHVVSQLLSRPASSRPIVRGTYRSEQSAKVLTEVFQEHVSAGNLELVQITDITVPGSFDKVLQGCTHVAHIASPLLVNPKDTVNDLLLPAIRGTTSLLESASKCGTIKAVAITSSFAAVFDPSQGLRPGYTYSAADWSPLEFDEIADPKLDLERWPERYRNFITYLASKKLAEKGAWDFHQKAKPSWYLTAINPTYIGGPSILPLAKGTDSFSFSQQLLWSVANSKPDDKLPPVDFPGWVDVRDVAKAHILALTNPGAANGRFVLAPYNITYSTIADIARKRYSQLSPSNEVQNSDGVFSISSKEARTTLGLEQWIDLEEMVTSTIDQALEAQKS